MSGRVTILMPNGRRRNIRVTPNTTLLQILEEACDKDGISSDDYILQHHRKDVPLSQMFRFSGLPNNCLLEMSPASRKRVLTSVGICLQFEDGSRKQAEFMPDNNLWEIAINLTDNQIHQYKSPVVIYMRQEIIGQENMSKTTLKSLGLFEGKALMRIMDKDPESLKTQASVYVESSAGSGSLKKANKTKEKEKPEAHLRERSKLLSNKAANDNEDHRAEQQLNSISVNKQTIVATSETSSPRNNLKDTTNDYTMAPTTSSAAYTRKREREGEQQDKSAETVEPTYNIIGERNALIYSLNTISRVAAEDLSDSFYDLTASDLKLILRQLKDIATGNEEAPMLTNDQRKEHENRKKMEKISRYQCCVIRVKFNDNYILQGMFKPTESIKDVIQFIKGFLNEPEKPFYVFTIPPKTKLPTGKTLLELDLVPNALVYFAFEDDKKITEYRIDSIIKAEYLQKLTSAEGATFAVEKLRQCITSNKGAAPENVCLTTV